MTSISDLVFDEKLRVMGLFKGYLHNEGVKLPENNLERRNVFINWYLKTYSSVSLEKNIRNLSLYYLYISEKRIEAILFQDAK